MGRAPPSLERLGGATLIALLKQRPQCAYQRIDSCKEHIGIGDILIESYRTAEARERFDLRTIPNAS